MHIAVLAALLLLPACEATDEIAHYSAGYTMACDAQRWTSPELAVAYVMTVARAREALQDTDGSCGPNCQRDLAWWERGAEAGARCAGND